MNTGSVDSTLLKQKSTRTQNCALPFFILITLCLLIGTAIILITPYGEFGDEETHFNYANHIRKELALPPLSFNVREMRIQQAFQPPLYYMFGALLLFIKMEMSTAVYVLRFFSLLLTGFSIWYVWKSSSLIFHARYAVLLSTAIVAFNPQFLYVNCGITSIAMMSMTGTVTIYWMIRTLLEKANLSRRACILGICFGAAMLSRSIAIFLGPLCLGVLYFAAKDEDSAHPKWFKYFALFLVSSFVVAGWWYVRNWILYGDPFAWKLYQATVGYGWIRREPFGWLYVAKALAQIHAYFWAYFGRQQFHAQVVDYSIYLFLQAIAMVGVWEILKSRGGKDPEFEPPNFNRKGFILLLATASLALIEILTLQWRIASPQGRYLYTGIASLAIPMAAGLIKIFPQKYRAPAAKFAAVFMFGMCVYLLLRYWLPHYRG
jgi:hypothetical protein